MTTPPVTIITHGSMGIAAHEHCAMGAVCTQSPEVAHDLTRPHDHFLKTHMKQQHTLMKYDPATGEDKPYPSHADQWRDWHGRTTAWLFNPWTGERRDARNVGSDVVGHLIIPPGAPIYLDGPLSGDLMDCVDRLGSEAETVYPRVWDHLLVYALKGKLHYE